MPEKVLACAIFAAPFVTLAAIFMVADFFRLTRPLSKAETRGS